MQHITSDKTLGNDIAVGPAFIEMQSKSGCILFFNYLIADNL